MQPVYLTYTLNAITYTKSTNSVTYSVGAVLLP